MKIKTMSIIPLVLLLFIAVKLAAQTTPVALVVKYDGELSAKEYEQINTMAADTNKVKLLLKGSHFFWYTKTLNNKRLDSSYTFAKQAQELSNKLHYTEGLNEANFMLCRTLVETPAVSNSNMHDANEIVAATYGEEKVRLLLIISEHFVFLLDSSRNQTIKAYPLLIQAKQICKSVDSKRWLYQVYLLFGKYYFVKGDITKGRDEIMQIIESCQKDGNKELEAHYWSELGLYMPETDSTYRDKIHSHQMAYKLYQQVNNIKEAAYSLRDAAILNTNFNSADTAEKQMLKVFSLLKSLNIAPTFATYLAMSNTYRFMGEYPKALANVYSALDTHPDEQKKMLAYETLADIYTDWGQPANSLPYYKKALDYYKSKYFYRMYLCVRQIVSNYISLGKPKEALNFINDFIKGGYPDVQWTIKELNASIYGDIYNALKNYDKAERYYLQMISFDTKAQAERKTDIGINTSITGAEAYYIIGRFYTGQMRFNDAKPYLLKATNTHPNLPSANKLREIHLMLFRVDSAQGNFSSAVHNFELHKKLSDSIFNATKSNQIADMEARYQTTEQRQKIKILNSQAQTQRAELQKMILQKNITFSGIAAVIIIAGLLYNGYRNKQKSNLRLQQKQLEINQQNTTLQHLLTDKDKLLIEKEWLLKEVHHRVKNNLQIVMSLLSTQSSYLENKAAFDAITESQNRVQAIALLHQKLYSSSNVSIISMPTYITDLTSFLSDCFNTKKRWINFELLIDPIELDLTQAVPLGLILNEAITNAIKYAFDAEGGNIIIALNLIADDTVLLDIADNGKGLPVNFNLKEISSLGMEMMKALSKQLGGNFQINNKPGVVISIEFKIEKVFHGPQPEHFAA